MSKLGQHAPHGFLSQAGIGIHDLGNGHSGGQRLENVGYGNTRTAHPRAASKMFCVSDNPMVHKKSLR